MPDYIINVKEKGAKKASQNIKNLTKSLAGAALAFGGVSKAADFFKNSITLSAQFESVERGFNNLAKSSGFSARAFDNFNKATDGTINSLTLMTKANNAMLLGITDSEDQMAQMFDIAQRLGASLGLDVTQSIDSLVTGLGRQSKLMLDNLGIMVDTAKANEDYAKSIGKSAKELTDQERKTAFINAAMAEGQKLVNQLGEETLSTKDAIAQANTAMLEMSIAIGDSLSPLIIKSANLFRGAAAAVTSYLNSLKDVDLAAMLHTKNEEELGESIKKTKQEIHNLRMENAQSTASFRDLRFASQSTKDEIADLERQLELLIEKQHSMNILMVDSTSPMETIMGNWDVMTQTIEKAEQTDDRYITNYLANVKKVKEGEESISDAINSSTEGRQEQFTQQIRAAGQLSGALGQLNTAAKGSALVSGRLAQAQAIADTYAGANKAFAQGGVFGFATGAAIIASGLANVVNISRSLGDIKAAATGADFVTAGPQLMMVGDNPSGQERVQVTPLGGDPNINGPQGGSVNISISGNVMSQDFVEGELAEQIKEAVRRGGREQFGLS